MALAMATVTPTHPAMTAAAVGAVIRRGSERSAHARISRSTPASDAANQRGHRRHQKRKNSISCGNPVPIQEMTFAARVQTRLDAGSHQAGKRLAANDRKLTDSGDSTTHLETGRRRPSLANPDLSILESLPIGVPRQPLSASPPSLRISPSTRAFCEGVRNTGGASAI
jgi:hypothetical protein